MTRYSRLEQIVVYAVLAFVVLACALPLIWLVLSSFKPVSKMAQIAISLSDLSFDNYRDALASLVPRWLFNTLVVTLATTMLGLVVAALAAFGFARYEFRGKGVAFALVVGSLALPEFATLLPSFAIMREMGFLNTYVAVVIPMAANALALFLLRQYFSQLPKDLFDAARLDGAGEFKVFWMVAVPLVRPGLGAAALILFLSSWNAYMLPLVMLSRTDEYTMPLGLALLQSELRTGYLISNPWGPITAGTVLAILPLIVALAVMQRNFVSGIMGGSLK